MRHTFGPILVITLLGVALACSNQTGVLDASQALDVAWQALEPNTSSHERANWHVAEVVRVAGRDVTAEYQGEASFGCWAGPTPAPNGVPRPSGTYWSITMEPRPATPEGQATPFSPTAPPAIPEPFLRQARFLIDAENGQVVARKLYCVIY